MFEQKLVGYSDIRGKMDRDRADPVPEEKAIDVCRMVDKDAVLS